ncbi:type-4 ice-structuring protein-like isoform X1 [Salarias fasciatus]|uniref:type-4 ice-structuring protein-like isoform X1 n=1 Tax=Salarias fasciatus TaxID=181472 RepID=UPI001176E2D3|nr:type-4 ice-structuring protein-like isoform X1 [Salarias fasciatus]
MKFSLIAAVVVLALAQGTFAEEATVQDKLTQYFEEIRAKMTEELSTLISNHDLANQASTFLQDKKTQLEPLASQFHGQVQAAASSVQEQIKPLAENVQSQLQPVIDNFQKTMEDVLRQLTEQARTIAN